MADEPSSRSAGWQPVVPGASAVLLAACDKPEPPSKPETFLRLDGSFGPVARKPSREGVETVTVPAPVVTELNAKVKDRIAEAVRMREPLGLSLQLGGPADDGWRMVATSNGKTVEKRVPPATNAAEAITNFDHTLNAALDELGVKMR